VSISGTAAPTRTCRRASHDDHVRRDHPPTGRRPTSVRGSGRRVLVRLGGLLRDLAGGVTGSFGFGSGATVTPGFSLRLGLLDDHGRFGRRLLGLGVLHGPGLTAGARKGRAGEPSLPRGPAPPRARRRRPQTEAVPATRSSSTASGRAGGPRRTRRQGPRRRDLGGLAGFRVRSDAGASTVCTSAGWLRRDADGFGEDEGEDLVARSDLGEAGVVREARG